LLSHPEFRELPFLVAACLAAANWLMAFLWLPESRPPQAANERSRPLFVFRPSVLRSVAGTQLGWMLVLNFLFYFAFASMESTYALFAEARFEWGEKETGLMFTGIGVVIVLMQGVVIGNLVRWIGEKRTLLAGYMALMVGLSVVGTAGVVGAVVIGSLLIATGNGLTTPNINALISRGATVEDQGLSLGLAASAAALARIIGPVVAGPLFEGVGEGIPMLVGAGAIAVAGLIALAFLQQPARAP
jgi:predicted MFS family arabinose efflux permease